jgi:hypothetical protein
VHEQAVPPFWFWVEQLHLLAGYVFCCSGVFVYQYIKFQEANKGGAILGASGNKVRAKDTNTAGGNSFQRSKMEVMEEMKRLQNELSDLDHRIKN